MAEGLVVYVILPGLFAVVLAIMADTVFGSWWITSGVLTIGYLVGVLIMAWMENHD